MALDGEAQALEQLGRRFRVRGAVARRIVRRDLHQPGEGWTKDPYGAEIEGGQRLTELLCRRATEVMGETVAAKGVPLYTDARHYAEKGIPIVLYGAGPHTIQEANAHRADERLPLSDLYKATEVVALTLLDLLGTE